MSDCLLETVQKEEEKNPPEPKTHKQQSNHIICMGVVAKEEGRYIALLHNRNGKINFSHNAKFVNTKFWFFY
jgi:hypothetical protein